jgi:ABC-2 type transport system permease protein
MGYKALAFVRRDFRTQTSYRLDFVTRVAGMFVTVATFYFISRIIDTAISPYMEQYGTDYFDYVLLGVAFLPFITLSTSSLAGAVLEYQSTGTLEVLFLSPTPFPAALVMSTLWRYCWAFVETLFFLVTASVLFGATLAWDRMSAAVLVVLLSIAANSGLGFINASFVLVTKRPSPLDRFLGLVVSLLAGVAFPIAVLPGWLRAFSHLLPATYSLNALRQILLQGAPLADVWQNLAILLGFTLVLLPVGLVAFRYAVRWAKNDGSLSHF